MIDLAWSWTLLWFCAAFYLSWLVFSAVWFLIALAHGDLDPRDPDHKVCVENVKDFTSAFLFSLETQHTIGLVMTKLLIASCCMRYDPDKPN